MPRSAHRPLQVLAALAVGAAVTIQGIGPASAVPAVGLGTAATFAVLAGTPNVTNTGPTVVSGSLGIAPAVAVVGFAGPPGGTVVAGTIEAATVQAADAKAALTTAYLDAAGRVDTQPLLGAALDGRTLTPGVYSGGAIGLGAGGVLTLNGGGDVGGVFIIRASSTLITLAGSRVLLIGGAQACNVYWQVTSSATFGTNSTFVGTVMALSDIQAQTGATVAGRLLARNGQVTLDTNTITRPTTCAAAAPPASSTTTSSTTTSTTSTTVRSSTTTTTGGTAVTVPAAGAPSGPGTPGAGTPETVPPDTVTSGSPELPHTGSDLGTLGLVAALLTMGGILLMAVARRRRTD